jgi:hypothetical protein
MEPSRVAEWLEALGGRRFLLVLGCGVVNAILVWFGKITSSDFVLVTSATVSVFIAGNAYQKTKGVPNASPTP